MILVPLVVTQVGSVEPDLPGVTHTATIALSVVGTTLYPKGYTDNVDHLKSPQKKL